MSKTYFLSKYALSDGVQAFKGEAGDDGRVNLEGFSSWVSFALGRDVHETEQEAIKAADMARVKKIASLRKQIARLEAETFEVKR